MKKPLLLACLFGAALGVAPLVAAAHHNETPAAATAAAPAKALVDLNSASKEELAKLPAIGEAIAAKIIAGRPWANKTQLLSKGLLSKAAYNKVAPLVVAKQAGK